MPRPTRRSSGPPASVPHAPRPTWLAAGCLLAPLIFGASVPAPRIASPVPAPSTAGRGTATEAGWVAAVAVAGRPRSGDREQPSRAGPVEPGNLPVRHLLIAAPAPAPGWRWPLPGRPRVVRAFDPPLSRYGTGHRGVDLAAAPETTVLAAGSGVVMFAGVLAGRGVLSVLHPGGLRTTYEPVRATVAVGARVGAGAVLGGLVAGHPGCPEPSCLHWGLRRGDAYLDPLDLFRRGPVRLLPVADGADAPPAVSGPARPGADSGTAGTAGPAAQPGLAAPGRGGAGSTVGPAAAHPHGSGGGPDAPGASPGPATTGSTAARQPVAQPAGRHRAPRLPPAPLAGTAGLAIALAFLISRRRPP